MCTGFSWKDICTNHDNLPTSVPKQPVRPALAAAGLAYAFFIEAIGPDCDKRLSKTKTGPSLGYLRVGPGGGLGAAGLWQPPD